ncbi:glutathione S-transferase-like [Prorops nasuta]|uniref:glutathione S-transferase-like n=1 Tax=Prorops nasuta TaxID=863751 RepID=UPI0034CD94F4
MSSYKLTYFNVMGLGEPIRFLLSYSGKAFQDIRLDHGDAEWKQLKPNTPFGQLPILEIDGKVYSQTLPICRFLAKQCDLVGKTNLDNLQIDAIAHGLHDLRKQVALFYRETDEKIKAARKVEALNTTVPFYLKKLEELAKNNGGYFHGGQLSYADLFFVAISDSLTNACEFDIVKDNPNLRKLKENVLAIPSIKAWIEKRPKLNF